MKSIINRKERKESAKYAKAKKMFSVNCVLCENPLRTLR